MIGSDTIVIVAVAGVLALLLFRPWIHGADGVRYYSYLRSMAIDGDLNFENEFRHYIADCEPLLREQRRDPETGRIPNAVPCGSAMMWAPWFTVAHLGVKIAGGKADGYGAPYAWAIGLATLFHALLGLLLLRATLRRWFASGPALAALLGVWLASPLVFYMFAHPSMSHGNSFFCVCLLLFLCSRREASTSLAIWAAIGIVAGMTLLVRFNNLLWIILPAVEWMRLLWSHRCSPGRAIGLGALCAVCAIVVFSPQLFAWKAMHGSFFSGPRDYKLSTWLTVTSSPHFFDALISGWRGLFFWTPIALVGVAGWIAPSRVPLRLRVVAPVILFALAWLIGGWGVWWAGASFGPRFFINCLPLLALGVASMIELAPGRARRLAYGAIALLVVWNAGLMAQYALRLIDRENELTRREIIVNQFTRVPQEVVRRAGDIILRKDPE